MPATQSVSAAGPGSLESISRISAGRALLVAFCATSLTFLWQFAQVRYLHQGNWTSLYYTGSEAIVPPALDGQEKIYRFPNVLGYDGQAYHLMAHDPLLRKGLSRYLDLPQLRYRRILVPALAAILAMGRDEFVDPAYFFVILSFIFLGAFWLSSWIEQHQRPVWWGLLFMLIPAALASASLMVVDVSVAALTVGAIYYAGRDSHAGLFLMLACALLARETGLLVFAAWIGWLLFRRRFRTALVYCLAILPAAAWLLFLESHTPPPPRPWFSPIPFAGLLRAFAHPLDYKTSNAGWLIGLDRVGLTGMIVAVGFVFYDLLRPREWNFIKFIAFAYSALAAILYCVKIDCCGGDVWPEVAAFSRAFSPFFLAVTMPGLVSRNWWRLIPLILVWPRLLAVSAVHLANVVRAVLANGL